jgi:tRNA(adenine34) deaminase
MKEWDRKYLERALFEAAAALREGYAPVAAVLVDRDGVLAGVGQSTTKPTGDSGKPGFPVHHAELDLIHAMATDFESGASDYNPPYTLYVSLEPCHMCMGAAIVARISRVVWACDDYWGGATKLYDSGRAYLQARMPELVRTPYPDLQARAAQLWVRHLNQYNLPDYIERMLRWQACLEE